MTDVFPATPKQVCNMVILKGIEDFPALTARMDDVHLAQAAQVIGNCRLADTNLDSEARHGLLGHEQAGQDSQAAGVCQGAKELGKLRCTAFIKRRWGKRFINLMHNNSLIVKRLFNR